MNKINNVQKSPEKEDERLTNRPMRLFCNGSTSQIKFNVNTRCK